MLLGLSYFVIQQENERHLEITREQVAEDVQDVARQLDEKFFAVEMAASRLATAAASSAKVPEELLAETAKMLVNRYPDIVTVAIAPDLVVTHVVPLEGNEKVMGMDYRQIPSQLPGVARAYRSHAPFLSDPLDLVQGGRGYVLRYPVFAPYDNAHGETFWGLISIVFSESQALTLPANQKSFGGDLGFALRRIGGSGAVVGDQTVFQKDAIIRPAMIFDTEWQVAAIPSKGWPKTSPNFFPIIVLLIVVSIVVSTTIIWMRRLSLQREQAHKLLANAVDAIDAGFVLYDRNDKLMICNSKFARFFGTTLEGMRPGVSYESLIRLTAKFRQKGDDTCDNDTWIEDRLSAHKDGQEFLYQRPDGGWQKISETRTSEGYSVSVISDITTQKKAQIFAEDASRQKTEFLSNVTHELRTPLTVIIGYAQILYEPAFLPQRAQLLKALERLNADGDAIRDPAREYDAAVAQHSKRIIGSAQHMLTMVNDLLDWAEVERGVINFEPEQISVAEMVSSVVEDLQSQAHDKGLELIAEFDDATVVADPKRLKQVLYNLVGNAIKFTETGSVRIGAHLGETAMCFSVEDTGCGIAQDDLDRVFERFQQVDGSNTRAYGGFGLGLSIARQIAALHGGTLTATSELGRGSRFVFDLPLEPVAVEQIAA